MAVFLLLNTKGDILKNVLATVLIHSKYKKIECKTDTTTSFKNSCESAKKIWGAWEDIQ